MKQGTYSRRSRGRGGSRKGGAPSGNRVIDSSGPEAKVRGNMHQVWEKYLVLARDATASGDRILAEGYYQHAEHYYRMLNANAANGGDAGGRKGKGQQTAQSSSQGGNGRERQGGNGASRGGSEAETAEATETAEMAEAEVIPTKTVKASKEETPVEDSQEDSEETSDGREALAIFPGAKGAETDDAEETPAESPDKDSKESDSAANK